MTEISKYSCLGHDGNENGILNTHSNNLKNQCAVFEWKRKPLPLTWN